MKRLFLCSQEAEEAYIEKHCDTVKDVMLATTNYQYYMKKNKSGKEIIFLEPDENLPYEDVWGIIDKMNDVIKKCQPDDSLIYMLSYHYEHYMPKTLATLILNLKLLDKVVDEYSIGHFYLVDDKNSWKINEAIFLYALSKNIAYTIIDDATGDEKDCLVTLRESAYDKNCIRGEKCEELERQEEERLKIWMQKESKPLSRNAQKVDPIGVLYCGKDCTRQVRWMKQLLKILNKNVIVISFYKSQDNEIFEKCGYTVYCLEEYFDKASFVNQYKVFREDRDKILHNIERMLSIKYNNIDVSKYLCQKVKNCFYREVPGYIYIYNCAQNYFASNCVDMLSAWGLSNFWETRVCYLSARNHNTKFFYVSRTAAVAWKNHEPWEDIISIRFYPNGYPHEQMVSEQFKGKVYYSFDVLGGIDYYEKKMHFENKYQNNNGIKIAFLPSYPLEGVKTFRNYENNCKVIIEKLSQCDCTVNFKNHPNMHQYLDDEIQERYGHIHNLCFIDKSESGDAVIQDSDLVITDGSLVIFDAAAYQKPVFIMASGSDYNLVKQHAGGFIIGKTPEDLCAQILDVIADKDYEQRINEIIVKQNGYLESLYGKYDSSVEQGIVEMIMESIRTDAK